MIGPEDSPYANGHFKLKLNLPDNYPFEPPKAQFITPIYHPNIDSEGRVSSNLPLALGYSCISDILCIFLSFVDLSGHAQTTTTR